MASDPRRIDELFHACRALASAAERKAFLDGACAGDADRRARLEALLAADAAAASGTFLEGARPSGAASGAVIGRYKLLEPLGEGGFGEVWMAEQREPVKRRVALKIIKLGMDTRQVIARFEAERQALALMDHPNIARVLDAGATASGRPYFVMELVRGVPILEYCDGERLDTEKRLALFVDVCHAIQHAHQKGIIHRDIKPSNILVTLHDGRPVPKVIDFGIAKATCFELTEKTLFTEHRQIVGTPAYMSPEQVEMSGLDVDTRSDVYSLGVLLYELLTGTTPFDIRELLMKGYEEMLRVLREVEPKKPSTRLSTLGVAASKTAERRNSDQRKLGSLLRGDLDWIVMRCLEKDRSRRYETANGLALDVERHLRGDAVLAAPPSAAYRLRKFVRRNKATVAAVAAVMLALVGGLAAALWQASRAREAEQRKMIVAEEEARQRRRAEFMSSFLVNSLLLGDPNHEGQAGILVADAMQYAVQEIEDGALANEPELEVQLRLTIAMILQGNGRPAQALELAKEGVESLRRLHAGADHDNIAGALTVVGECLVTLGRYAEALPLHAEALEMRQRLFLADDPKVALGLNNYARNLTAVGRYAEALPMFERAYAIHRAVTPPDEERLAMGLHNLAFCLAGLGRETEALPLFEESLAMQRRISEVDDPDLALAIENVGNCLLDLSRPAEALANLEAAAEMYGRIFPGDDLNVVRCLVRQSTSLAELGRFEEALTRVRTGIAIHRRILPGDHPMIGTALIGEANVLTALGRTEEAIPLRREAHAMAIRLGQADSPEIASSYARLAFALLQSGAAEAATEAEAAARRSLEIRRKLYPDGHPDAPLRFNAMSLLGGALAAQGKFAEAESLLVDGYSGLVNAPASAPPDIVTRAGEALARIVALYEAWNAREPSEERAAKAAEWRRRAQAKDTPPR